MPRSSASEGGLRMVFMYYVYILQSLLSLDRYYIGFTEDLKRRMTEHNSGSCNHTSKHVPWKLKNYVAFENKEKAKQFEEYLKSGSGRIFTKKHF